MRIEEDFGEALPGEGATVDRTLLDVSQCDLPLLTERAIEALIARNDPPTLFRRGGVIVRIDHDEDGGTLIRAADVSITRHAVAKAVRCVRVRDVGKAGAVTVDVAPPKVIVENILATPNVSLPVLRGVAAAPFFSRDGRIVAKSGYDRGSGVFLDGDDEAHLAVPDDPSDNEIASAVALLDDIFTDFPFVSDADRAHTFALVLVQPARELIDGLVPLLVTEAPAPGSGKGLLVQAALSIWNRVVAFTTAGRDEDEWRKRITSLLVRGRPYIVLDNLRGKLDSGQLAAALTAPIWEDRLLGSTMQVLVPNRAVWIATANNVTLSSEIARRSVSIRIDPRVERPSARTGFRHANLLEYVAANRATLSWAALTIVRAWVARGRPLADATLGSFEAWARVIGGILEVSKVPGFLGNVERMYESTDDETTSWRAFVNRWAQTFGSKDVVAKELVQLTEGIFSLDGDDRSQTTRLGKMLTGVRDRVFGDNRIERREKFVRGVKPWALVPIGPKRVDLGGHGGHLPANPHAHARGHLPEEGPETSTRSTMSTMGQGEHADEVRIR